MERGNIFFSVLPSAQHKWRKIINKGEESVVWCRSLYLPCKSQGAKTLFSVPFQFARTTAEVMGIPLSSQEIKA